MAGFIIFLVVLSVVLSIPAVQTFLAKKLTHSVNEKFGTRIFVDKVDLSFLGTISLRGIYIEDYQKDTLIFVDKLNTSLVSASNLMRGRLEFGSVKMETFLFNMTHYKGDSLNTLDTFTAKLESGSAAASDKPFYMEMKKVLLIDGHYKFFDYNRDYPENADLKKLNAFIDQFVIEGPNVYADVQKLQFNGFNGLEVERLTGNFAYTTDQIRLDNMQLTTTRSNLKGQFALLYNRGDFSDFNNKIRWDFNIEEAAISLADINLFYDEFDEAQIALQTHVTGTLNDFLLKDTKVSDNVGLGLEGDVALKNIFNDMPLYLEGKISDLRASHASLTQLMPRVLGNNLPELIAIFGHVSTFGYVELNGDQILLDVDVETQIGNGKVNGQLQQLSSLESVRYEGNISTQNIELAELTQNANLGQLSGKFNIKGNGFNAQSMNAFISGFVEKIGFNGYDFSGIKLLGNLDKGVYEGKLEVDDYNLKANFEGRADLTKTQKSLSFSAQVPYANLFETKLYTRDKLSVFSGNVAADFNGSNIDDFTGLIRFTNTTYGNIRDEYYFDDFTIQSSFTDKLHTISINSKDIVDGSITGVYKVSELEAMFANALGSFYSNYTPKKVEPGQYANFKFDVYNKLLDAFFPGIVLGSGTEIKGSVNAQNNEMKFSLNADKILLYENEIEGFNLQFDNQNPLYNTYVEVDKIHTSTYDFSELSLINIKARDTLFFKANFSGGPDHTDTYDLNLFHTINKSNQSVVGFKKSDILFKGNQWFINRENEPTNYAVFTEGFKNISINKLFLKHQNEEIGLNGVLRDSTYKDLKVSFKDVHLYKITPQIDSLKMDGVVNGNLLLLESDNVYFPTSFLKINDFEVNNQQMGNLRLDIISSDNLSQFDVSATLTRKSGLKSIDADGKVYFEGERPMIDMDLSLKELDLKGFSPLGGTAIDKIRGQISGNAQLTGPALNPNWEGSLSIYKGGMSIPYLNVDLAFPENAKIVLDKKSFLVNNWKINDTKYKTQAILNGSIGHSNFSDWDINMGLKTDRLLVLDTKEDLESLYYGLGFISGDATLRGPLDNMVIDVTAQTKTGTNFVIPISDAATVGDSSFIRFITPEEKILRGQGGNNVFEEIKGLTLNFDLDVTPEAQIEVMIDQENGSFLRGNGVGNLLIEINTNGRFNMWGDFIAMNGNYNFKYKGLIDKKFEVIRGGTITWDGDPLQAQVNLQAVYRTEANPSILLESQAVTRKIPTQVYINLEGNLTKPDVDFNIEFPNANSQIRSEMQFRLEDAQERQRQALSLISAGTFFGDSNRITQAGANLASESLSNIVNDLFQDDNDNFNFGIDYVQADRTPDYEAQGRVGVTFQTQINDRVLINGKVGVPTGGVTESVVVGDVEVEFLLNDDGSLRAKVFNRQNQIRFIGEQEGYTQGVGMSYQVDFDSFKELMRKIFSSKKNPQTIVLPQNNQPASSPLPGFIEFKNNR